MRRPGLGASLALLALLGAAPRLAGAQDLAPSYLIEKIDIRGNDKTRDYVIRRALRVWPGERISAADPRFAHSRYRVLALGFFSDVRLRLEKGTQRGRAILVVEVAERGTIILTDVFLGTSEATTFWGGLGMAESNFLGRGIGVEGAFVLGSSPDVERAGLQQSYRLRVIGHQLRGTSVSLTAGFTFLDGSDFFRRAGPESSSDPRDFLSIRYRRVGGTLGVGFDLARYLRMYVDYRAEAITSDLPLGAVRQDPGGGGAPIPFGISDGTSLLSLVSLSVERDTRSDPVLPQRGSLFLLAGDVATSLLGSTYDYFKLSASYQKYFPLRWGHVVAIQTLGGVVFGEAPFFEKFFIGDYSDLVPSRALGLNFSTLPSRDIFGTSIDSMRYEEFALRLSTEYIIPWFRGGRFVYGGDLFVNIGLICLTSRAALQLRDRPLSESIPVDLTLDAGLRLDTRIGVFRISLGNGLGRIPF